MFSGETGVLPHNIRIQDYFYQYLSYLQCCRSRILLFLGLPDPDPLVRGTDPDPFIIKQKKVRKTLIPIVLRLLYDFLSLKNDVNVALKSNKQKKTCRSPMKIAESRAGSGVEYGSGSVPICHGSATMLTS
jgi:hypothetical protein